ncbi:hypothetical protein BHMPCIPO_02526 [Ensifer sesbaniae]|nr:hypothetical protein [Ensifer sesbaniae]
MITQPYRLYIERKDATKNMARFYSLEIGSNLFGKICLTRRGDGLARADKRRRISFRAKKTRSASSLIWLAASCGADIARGRGRGQKNRPLDLVAPRAGRPPAKCFQAGSEKSHPTWKQIR